MTIRITAQVLRDAGACGDQVDAFIAAFGFDTPITVELALKYASVFDWDWASTYLLRAPAWAEYDKVRATARAEYDKVCATAWAEYDKVCAVARAGAALNHGLRS